MKKRNIIFSIVAVVLVAILFGVAGYFVYSFDLNRYLPGKVILDTHTSGAWGKFNADHTITLNWGLDYAGQNDNRPSGGVGNWSVNKNVLTITGSSNLAGKYDFSKMGKINVGNKIVYASQYSKLDDGRYVGVFIGDNFASINKLTGTNIPDVLNQTPVQTSDFKIYKDLTLGFEFQYPKDWGEPKTNTWSKGSSVSLLGDKFYIQVGAYTDPATGQYFTYDKLAEQTLTSLRSQTNDGDLKDEEITLDNTGAIKISYTSWNTPLPGTQPGSPNVMQEIIRIFAPAKSGVLDISYQFPANEKNIQLQIFNTIISTFKFTK